MVSLEKKKGHFRIREYFDLYLTQGPYFTQRFNELKAIHKNFDVIETGWPKLDVYYKNHENFNAERQDLIKTHKCKKIILYAPTFSPKLTSAPFLIEEIKTLANNKEYLILLKFHPLMDKTWIFEYEQLANGHDNIVYVKDKDITQFLIISDLIISDTSSVVYEFLLLNKPVITFNSISTQISWKNLKTYKNLDKEVAETLTKDRFAKFRKNIINEYHPYVDGASAKRMVDAVVNYLETNKIPKKRKISTFRKLKTYYKILNNKI